MNRYHSGIRLLGYQPRSVQGTRKKRASAQQSINDITCKRNFSLLYVVEIRFIYYFDLQAAVHIHAHRHIRVPHVLSDPYCILQSCSSGQRIGAGGAQSITQGLTTRTLIFGGTGQVQCGEDTNDEKDIDEYIILPKYGKEL